jgi:Ca2+/Na+ antiporter
MIKPFAESGRHIMNAGLIGGIIGGIIGIAGGVIGTYFSIKNTNGPKERAFMIKASVAFWIFGILFIILLFTLSSPYKWFLWLFYGIFLPISIRIMNTKLCQVKQEEVQDK